MNYTSNTTNRIGTVSCFAWDQMHMRIHHSLSSSLATVDAHIVGFPFTSYYFFISKTKSIFHCFFDNYILVPAWNK